MKTLILNGSPRKNGETAALLAALELPGEVAQIDAFSAKVSPCLDCRYCRTHAGCCIRDEMQDIYRQIEESDCIILASPVWLESLPGPLMTLASRLQCVFSAVRFQGQPKPGGKKGAVILTAGGSGCGGAYRIAEMLLRQMGVRGEIPLVSSVHTDRIPAVADEDAIAAAAKLSEYFREP